MTKVLRRKFYRISLRFRIVIESQMIGIDYVAWSLLFCVNFLSGVIWMNFPTYVLGIGMLGLQLLALFGGLGGVALLSVSLGVRLWFQKPCAVFSKLSVHGFRYEFSAVSLAMSP